MKSGFNILLNLKLGCHKNNKNVKKLSAMLKKYPKEQRVKKRETCFKPKKKNRQFVGAKPEFGKETNKYACNNEYYAAKIVFQGPQIVLGDIKIIDVVNRDANFQGNHHILL